MALDELRSLLTRHARPDLSTPIEDVRIFRADRPTPPAPTTYGRVFALVVQGTKRFALGDRLYEYGVGQYLVASVDLPVTAYFARATPELPGLGVGLTLHSSAVAEMMLQAAPGDLPDLSPGTPAGLAISTASGELIDAVARLVRLFERPRDMAVLAPLIKREILWLLLTGDQGAVLRQFGLPDSNVSHVARAVQWIRDHYAQTFRVAEVAHQAGMSASALHRHFQAVTGMSPIQFQKRIRLQHARLLLAAEPGDIAGISRRVGYESPAQFSREYHRQFGGPPSRDAARLPVRSAHRSGSVRRERA